MTITLTVLDSTGTAVASSTGSETVYLVHDKAYQEGDTILVECSYAGAFVEVCLDNAMQPATLFLKDTRFLLPIAFGDKKGGYPPQAFEGEQHRLMARIKTTAELPPLRNLALNPYDHDDNDGSFPHAQATVITRGEAAFAARNAIDGEIANSDHGYWPYTSWGINCDPDAAITVHFGRSVLVQDIVFYNRADFPHDAWWESVTLTLSNGWSTKMPLQKSANGQRMGLGGMQTEWLRLDQLIKADDPSPFPALTQIEIWGREKPA